MDKLQQKDFGCSRGLNYHYYISDVSSADSSKPALVLLHGWPDSSALWQFIVPQLANQGYRLVVPDLLAYGGSSKPIDPKVYTWAEQAKDLIELLDNEGIKQIIPIGHDWGSVIAQRLYHFYPSRVNGIVLLCVWYIPPLQYDQPMDAKITNDGMEEFEGYRRLAYQEFFIQDDAAKIWEDHLESAWNVMHGDDPLWMKKMFCTADAMREYLLRDGQDVLLKPFAQSPSIRDEWLREMRKGGLTAPFAWYRSSWANFHGQEEIKLAADRATVNVPMLYISCDQDCVCLAKDMIPAKEAGLLPDLRMEEIKSGHWCPYEAPDEVSRLVKHFLEDKKF